MLPTTEPEGTPFGPDDGRALERRVDDLTRYVAELTQIVTEALDHMVTTPRAGASRATDARGIERPESRLAEVERQTSSVERTVERHESMLRMLCVLVKELDDPYGMGCGLDDRLGLGGHLDCEDRGEPS